MFFMKYVAFSLVHPEAQGQWCFQQQKLEIHDDLGFMKTDPLLKIDTLKCMCL